MELLILVSGLVFLYLLIELIKWKRRLEVFRKQIDDSKNEIDKKITIIEGKEKKLKKFIMALRESAPQTKKWLVDEYILLEELSDKNLILGSRGRRDSLEKAKTYYAKMKEWRLKAIESDLTLKEIKALFPGIDDYIDEELNSVEDFGVPPPIPDTFIPEEISLEGLFKEGQSESNYLSKDEFDSLTPVQRSDLALLRYKEKRHSKWEIGLFYERQIGALYENKGYVVDYFGAIHGYDDLGRDLIVENESEIVLIQAKCWSSQKKIREKHIFNLYGTLIHFKKKKEKINKPIIARFYTTTSFSDTAEDVASLLGIQLRFLSLDKNYPMVKCNINNGRYIYHLPFDQQYDRVKIISKKGERYVRSASEAEQLGFRRAMRWSGEIDF